MWILGPGFSGRYNQLALISVDVISGVYCIAKLYITNKRRNFSETCSSSSGIHEWPRGQLKVILTVAPLAYIIVKYLKSISNDEMVLTR